MYSINGTYSNIENFNNLNIENFIPSKKILECKYNEVEKKELCFYKNNPAQEECYQNNNYEEKYENYDQLILTPDYATDYSLYNYNRNVTVINNGNDIFMDENGNIIPEKCICVNSPCPEIDTQMDIIYKNGIRPDYSYFSEDFIDEKISVDFVSSYDFINSKFNEYNFNDFDVPEIENIYSESGNVKKEIDKIDKKITDDIDQKSKAQEELNIYNSLYVDTVLRLNEAKQMFKDVVDLPIDYDSFGYLHSGYSSYRNKDVYNELSKSKYPAQRKKFINLKKRNKSYMFLENDSEKINFAINKNKFEIQNKKKKKFTLDISDGTVNSHGNIALNNSNILVEEGNIIFKNNNGEEMYVDKQGNLKLNNKICVGYLNCVDSKTLIISNHYLNTLIVMSIIYYNKNIVFSKFPNLPIFRVTKLVSGEYLEPINDIVFYDLQKFNQFITSNHEYSNDKSMSPAKKYEQRYENDNISNINNSLWYMEYSYWSHKFIFIDGFDDIENYSTGDLDIFKDCFLELTKVRDAGEISDIFDTLEYSRFAT